MRLSPLRLSSVMIAFTCAGLIAIWTPALWAIRSTRYVTPVILVDHDINDGGAALRAVASVKGAWVPSQDGLALEPGRSGQVVLRVDGQKGAPLVLRTWFYAGGGLHNAVECSNDGESFVELVRDRRLNGDSIALDRCLEHGTLWIRFSGRNDSSTSALRLSLDKIQVVKAYPLPVHAYIQPAASGVLLGGLTCWLAGARPPGWLAGVFVGLLTWVVCALTPLEILRGAVRLPGLAVDGTWLASGAALVVAWMGNLSHQDRVGERAVLARLTLVWIVGVGACSRWDQVVASAMRPLDPDPLTVVGLAAAMRGPYDTSFREPMWLWALKVFQLIVGHPEMALRLFSLTSSLALIVAGAWLARRATQSELMGLAVAWFLAGHPYLIESSASGLRTEFNALCLALIAGLTLVGGRPSRGAPFALGAALAAATLAQLNSLAASVPMLAVGVVRGRIHWRTAAAAIAVTSAAVAPYIVMSYNRFGGPLWSVNVHGIWYRNYEFVSVKKTGCPGCPTPELLARDSYAGEPVTMAGYVFGMHSPGEVARRILQGYLMAYAIPTPLLATLLGSSSRLVWILYIAGLVLILKGPERELFLLPAASLNLLAFVVPLGIDPRLVMPAVPFVAVATCRPIAVMAAYLASYLGLASNLPAAEG